MKKSLPDRSNHVSISEREKDKEARGGNTVSQRSSVHIKALSPQQLREYFYLDGTGGSPTAERMNPRPSDTEGPRRAQHDHRAPFTADLFPALSACPRNLNFNSSALLKTTSSRLETLQRSWHSELWWRKWVLRSRSHTFHAGEGNARTSLMERVLANFLRIRFPALGA